jgi:hypothetical protein
LRQYAASWKVAVSIPDVITGYFEINECFQPHYGLGVDSASNGKEYDE